MNKGSKLVSWVIIIVSLLVQACSAEKQTIEADILVVNGKVVDGTGSPSFEGAVAIKDDKIVFVGVPDTVNIVAQTRIDAEGNVISPGFIDPHTHSLGDLKSKTRNGNINYLTQGVTTVMNGNDGEGPYAIDRLSESLLSNGIGTNTAFFVGHGTVRNAILGKKDIAPDSTSQAKMEELVKQGMLQGAFGLSAGLYYSPGSFSETREVTALAKVIQPFGGLYESHIRDESTYNVGLVEAIKEAIEIGRMAGVPVHIAHIKALGVDVWGKSNEVIELIENARSSGLRVTADQYPWQASGTHIGNALLNRWVMEGGKDQLKVRLNDEVLLPKIKAEIIENMRRRGGAQALLVTADCWDEHFIGMNLSQIAQELEISPVEATLFILRHGGARVASFNMDADDIKNFMQQSWVMTCSDGTKGHPRKFASFPKKYETYVEEHKVLTLAEFVYRSSGLVAETYGFLNRGKLKNGYLADVVIWNPKDFSARADFSRPEILSTGVEYLFVNGQLTIEKGNYTGVLSGRVLRKNKI